MKIVTEKEKFSERLKIALAMLYSQPLKTSDIATRFNLRHPNEPVTQQAVHKWLNGLAIPSMDKIETLAKWLQVKPEWLRYGISDEQEQSALDEALFALIKPLSHAKKEALIKLVIAFSKESC
ncbi:helix-turn-helix domain-containing protein [Volucribacter amazonae]|uniref:Transcriptional regulator n=1 Tax=Volucribacter amazonae TaxID=256731 RepID=A0A9X4SLC6_9PAST|nr:helix-turn-helix domain-containing protein [Volucribacter amazonae]MDG6896024.1 transcriptional regulator [Volucribacter amazonae]